MDEECLAGGTGRHPSAGAHEQPLPELLFEQGDLTTETGLCQVEGNRRATKAAALGDRDERL